MSESPWRAYVKAPVAEGDVVREVGEDGPESGGARITGADFYADAVRISWVDHQPPTPR